MAKPDAGLDMVLEDVTELYISASLQPGHGLYQTNSQTFSDYTGTPNKLTRILLNGNNICMVVQHLLPSMRCYAYLS